MKILEQIEQELMTYNKSETIQKPELLLITGTLDFSIMSQLINLIKAKLESMNVSNGIISRTKLISTEIVQNVFKHGDLPGNSYFAIYLDTLNQQLILKSGNLIDKSTSSNLISTLTKYSSLNKDDLKSHFVSMMKDSVFKTGENAGLGLISMFYRSKGLVNYKISNYNNHLDYFSLQIKYNYN